MSASPLSPVDRVSAALSVANLQQKVIASNIANRDTPGYRRLQLQFDRALEGTNATLVEAQPDQPVALEKDLVAAASNAANYGTLARVLNRYFSIVNAITNNGRG